MPTIKDKTQFTNAFKKGVVYLYEACQMTESEALFFLEKHLHRAAKTIKHWGYASAKQHIDDELLYGFAWLVMSNSDAPVIWLEELFSTTTCIVVQPMTSDWLRRCFSMAAHGANGGQQYQYPAPEAIDAVIERCFSSQAAPPPDAAVPPVWMQPVLSILRLIQTNPDRLTPLPMTEHYWEGLMRDKMPLRDIDDHYSDLQNALAMSHHYQHHEQQVTMTVLLLHYLHARWLMTERLTYVYSAIDAARHLQSPAGLWLMAMLSIDGLGWILLEQENYLAALPNIEAGLEIAAQIEPEPNTGYYDLTVLGKVYLALFHLENQKDITQAQTYLDEVRDLPCHPMIKSHYWRVCLLVAAANNDLNAAESAYFAGLNLFYRNAAPIAKAGFFITAAEVFLRLRQHWKARVFLQAQPVQNLDSHFSLPWYVEKQTISAQIALAEKKPQLAYQELHELFTILQAKQKMGIKSRLLNTARRLYDDVKQFG